MTSDIENQASWRELYPFQSNFFERDGLRLHYLDEGQGVPVVMFHGNPTWSFMYRNLVWELVRRGRRAIVVDNIGCGLSDKPRDYSYRLEDHIGNAEALMENLGLGEMDIVVHDWGGAIGFGYAVRHPEKIRRMTAANTAAFLFHQCPLRIRICKIPFFGTLAVRGFNAFARSATVMATGRGKRLPPPVKAGYLAPYDSYANRIATLRFVQDIPLSRRHPTWKTVAHIQKNLCCLGEKPFLLCWGMQDFCFTPAFLEKWLEYFPDARVGEYPDAGHYLFEDAHPEVTREIADFLTAT